eukprot:jgi/Chlat1/7145/Chrsp57S06811
MLERGAAAVAEVPGWSSLQTGALASEADGALAAASATTPPHHPTPPNSTPTRTCTAQEHMKREAQAK